MAVLAPIFLIVNAQTPCKNVQELIAWGRSRPDGITFGSPGPGSQPHLAAELLLREAGVKGVNVPFRGEPPTPNCWQVASMPR
jgi:tripartite-type tricarboxylate transporter receptor subunit TctC